MNIRDLIIVVLLAILAAVLGYVTVSQMPGRGSD